MFLDIKSVMQQSLINQLPLVLVLIVSFFVIRFILLVNENKKISFHHELMILYFLVYISFVYQIVTTQDLSWNDANFIPFREILRYEFGSNLFFLNVIGNIIMYIPYGMFISYFIKHNNIIVTTLTAFITSLTIEVSQQTIGRVIDIDDIILNVTGAIIGYLLFHAINSLYHRLPASFQNRVLLHLSVIIMTSIIIGYYWVAIIY